MTLMDVAHDFAVVSILLAIGYFLRMKVKLFQRLFLPASIIGGLVGLIPTASTSGPVYCWPLPLLAHFWASQWKKYLNKQSRRP